MKTCYFNADMKFHARPDDISYSKNMKTVIIKKKGFLRILEYTWCEILCKYEIPS